MKLTKRAAGLLMHVTSLPSKFGSGDFGPEAYAFVNFLKKAGQHYWQILPLSETSEESGYSPYNALSSYAINTMLISPELLAKQGLLTSTDLKAARIAPSTAIDFTQTSKNRQIFLRKAWANFQKRKQQRVPAHFRRWEKNNPWVHDYALFAVLRERYGTVAWYHWSKTFRDYSKVAIHGLRSQLKAEIEEQKWYQFIAWSQWNDVHTYSKRSGIKIIGDLPFYVSHNSADVWLNRSLFALHKDGTIAEGSGVPPDFFSSEGQLWGMPVYLWEKHKRESYRWWKERINVNARLYDVLRLDHFRAFSSFWAVPANKQSRAGRWRKGPGDDFVMKLRRMKNLAFIAEDLGYIDDHVKSLHVRSGFPGMKVVQFAFDDWSGRSVDLPQNYVTNNCVAYSGTHDNNTTLGWFRRETQLKSRRFLDHYAGVKVRVANVNSVINHLVWSSVADTAIIPVQDVLNLNESSRMNMPATSLESNWRWKLKSRLPTALANSLFEKMELFNRLPAEPQK